MRPCTTTTSRADRATPDRTRTTHSSLGCRRGIPGRQPRPHRIIRGIGAAQGRNHCEVIIAARPLEHDGANRGLDVILEEPLVGLAARVGLGRRRSGFAALAREAAATTPTASAAMAKLRIARCSRPPGRDVCAANTLGRIEQAQRRDQFRDAPGLRGSAVREVRRVAVGDLAQGPECVRVEAASISGATKVRASAGIAYTRSARGRRRPAARARRCLDDRRHHGSPGPAVAAAIRRILGCERAQAERRPNRDAQTSTIARA